MHFNSKELLCLATQTCYKFDKEGVLLVKEKQEGLFRRNDVYQERLCRLRGNLLFYYKSRDPYSEPLGVWVLEQFSIKLGTPADPPFSFSLLFHEDECQQLVAPSQSDRDAWIQILHMASYEYVRSQLFTLKDQICRKTGSLDLVEETTVKKPRNFACIGGHYDSLFNEPFLELSIACDNLKCNIDGLPPSPLATISICNPPSLTWVKFSHTEILEKCSNPCFMTTFTFAKGEVIESTKIKLNVYNVKERMTMTKTLLGECVFTLINLLQSQQQILRLTLVSPEFCSTGFVTVFARELDSDFSTPIFNTLPVSATSAKDLLISQWKRTGSYSLPGRLSLSSNLSAVNGLLGSVYSNFITQTFRFPTGLGAELRIQEVMAESKFNFTFPQHLLNLWIQEEKKLMDYIFQLGELPPEWQRKQLLASERHMHLINVYTEALNSLSSYKGPSFKPSSLKGDPTLEFVPANLHLQRMVVQNLTTKKTGIYDITAVGIFSAYCQGYKHGGLLKMLKPSTPLDSTATHLTNTSEAIDYIEKFQGDMEQLLTDITKSAAVKNVISLYSIISNLNKKGLRLVDLCQARLPEEVVSLWESLEKPNQASKDDSHLDLRKEQVCRHSSVPMAKTPDCPNGKMILGTEAIRNWTHLDDLEPLDLIYLNIKASIMCMGSKVSHLQRLKDEPLDWTKELQPCIHKLQSAVAGLHNTAKVSYSLLALKESPHSASLGYKVRWRRDVVFSQALTALVSSLMTRLWCYKPDKNLIQTLRGPGALAQFEGLLSCHANEICMLEDMTVAIADLSRVHFYLEPSNNPLPRTEGNRAHLQVVLPVPESLVATGFSFTVTPAFFNMGINEKATIAERLGTLSLQERINVDGCSLLKQYYLQLLRAPNKAGLGVVPQLFDQLVCQINSKKSKNVTILHLASEITRILGGLRFTSCKSAKDRTSMSITLEQATILRNNFNLDEPEFLRALNCMRSEGTRMENPYKNVGIRKYHFNKLQLFAFPRLYIPPPGTYGNMPKTVTNRLLRQGSK